MNTTKRLIYICQMCDIGPVCRKCAIRLIDDPRERHEADHLLSRWQPTWFFDVEEIVKKFSLDQTSASEANSVLRALEMSLEPSRDDYHTVSHTFFLGAPQGQFVIIARVRILGIGSATTMPSTSRTPLWDSRNPYAGALRLEASIWPTRHHKASTAQNPVFIERRVSIRARRENIEDIELPTLENTGYGGRVEMNLQSYYHTNRYTKIPPFKISVQRIR